MKFNCLRLLLLFIAALPISTVIGQNADFGMVLNEANVAFETENYSAARLNYQLLFEEGIYTEKMLYRLAFMNEKLRNYPNAIYFLKKIKLEYGGKKINEKIVSLHRKNGSTNYLSADIWSAYFLFFNRFGWLIWACFILFLGVVIAKLIFNPEEKMPKLRIPIRISVFGFLFLFLVLGYKLFLAPDRGVITTQTAFYDEPAYGSPSRHDALSTGETVRIKDESDIWFQVRAGNKEYWVPKMVISPL